MKKRKLNGKFISLVCVVIIIIISLFKIPSYKTHKNLEALGFSKEAVEKILERKMNDTILDNSYYSDFLNQEIVKDSFNEKYLNLYLNRTSLSQDDIDLYEKLASKKEYSVEDLDKVFIALQYNEIQPLLLFDKQSDLDKYINDVKNNTINSLKGNYLKDYEDIVNVSDKSSIEVVVNKKRSIGDYAPSELTTLGLTYSIRGVQLENKAYEAFYNELAPAAHIYATRGYVSYEDQDELYNLYDLPSDAEERGVLRPGHNEKQTGLIVEVTCNEMVKNQCKFNETAAYKFLKEHAHEYGFIFRYPVDKKIYTGFADTNENILRYVGVNLATKIHETGLSLEEYQAYYMD